MYGHQAKQWEKYGNSVYFVLDQSLILLLCLVFLLSNLFLLSLLKAIQHLLDTDVANSCECVESKWYSFLKFFSFIYWSRERERKGGGEGEKHGCERETLLGCLLHGRPDWRLHVGRFGLWDDAIDWATAARTRVGGASPVQHATQNCMRSLRQSAGRSLTFTVLYKSHSCWNSVGFYPTRIEVPYPMAHSEYVYVCTHTPQPRIRANHLVLMLLTAFKISKRVVNRLFMI